MKKLYVLVAAAVLACTACSKKDDGDKPEPGNGAAELYAKVLGRWSFELVSLETGRKSFARTNEMPRPGFIEFLSDSTYYLYDAEGKFFTGSFSPKDSVTISLGSFGTISAISFAANAISFKLTYSGREINISANTTATGIALSDSAKLLCKKWYLTKEESGASVFNNEQPIYDASGEISGWYVPDSLNVQFTSGGTYLVQFFKAKQLAAAEVRNWKWHSTLAKYIAYWEPGREVDEEGDKVQIRELTKDVLKITESRDYNGDDIISDYEISNWTLKPVSK